VLKSTSDSKRNMETCTNLPHSFIRQIVPI
jgi:hypothetical protein